MNLRGPGLPVRRVVRLEERLCNACRDCLPACASQALIWVRADHELLIDPWNCTGCGDCVRVCPTGALWMSTVAAQ